MEKISRILPPSARTAAYDVSRAHPGRPGAPQMGRPRYESVADRFTLSEQLTQSMADSTLKQEPLHNSKLAASEYKSQDNVRAQMVREMTDNFFLKNQTPKDLVKETDQTHSEEVVARALEATTESRVNPDSSSELSL